MNKLTHLNESGEAHMVDVGAKRTTRRIAVAEGYIHMQPETFELLYNNELPKGDALATARIAGLMAAKRTADLIPLCHPLALTHVEVTLQPGSEGSCVQCRARTETLDRTGVEMEALTAVQVALLTLYDMCKAVDRSLTISGVCLVHKSGGRSGQWDRDPEQPLL